MKNRTKAQVVPPSPASAPRSVPELVALGKLRGEIDYATLATYVAAGTIDESRIVELLRALEEAGIDVVGESEASGEGGGAKRNHIPTTVGVHRAHRARLEVLPAEVALLLQRLEVVVHPVGRPDAEVLPDLAERRRKAALDDGS